MLRKLLKFYRLYSNIIELLINFILEIMKKTILNLEGVEVLSKKEMRRVDGGEKCKSEPADGFYENDGAGSGTYNGGAVN